MQKKIDWLKPQAHHVLHVSLVNITIFFTENNYVHLNFIVCLYKKCF